MRTPRVSVYPGTFDPITNGHMDVISRASKVADRLVIAISEHHVKETLFTLDERLAMVEAEVQGLTEHDGTEFEVRRLDKLLMDFVDDVGAGFVIRGLRAVSDFEYELQMALMNRRLQDRIETLFMVPHEEFTCVSSSLVKEVFSLGGSISGLVPASVEELMAGKIHGHKEGN